MKWYFIAIILVCCESIYSQNVIKQFKEFYEKADMDCYIDKAQQRIKNQYYLLCTQDSVFNLYAPLITNIDLHQINIVPILNVQFINIEIYNYSDNIYDYITIDSIWTFSFVCVDKRRTVYAFANLATPFLSYWNIDDKKSEQLIKSIDKQEPELILYCFALASGFGKIYNNGFMYLKGDKIYLYDKFDRKSYELNDYLRKFFTLKDIRSLNFTCVPYDYQNDGDSSFRCTGNTPENWKIICPR